MLGLTHALDPGFSPLPAMWEKHDFILCPNVMGDRQLRLIGRVRADRRNVLGPQGVEPLGRLAAGTCWHRAPRGACTPGYSTLPWLLGLQEPLDPLHQPGGGVCPSFKQTSAS